MPALRVNIGRGLSFRNCVEEPFFPCMLAAELPRWERMDGPEVILVAIFRLASLNNGQSRFNFLFCMRLTSPAAITFKCCSVWTDVLHELAAVVTGADPHDLLT